MSTTVEPTAVDGVFRITISAGGRRADLLAEVGQSLLSIEADDAVRVVILALPDGLHGLTDGGTPVDLGSLLRWRNLRKVTIAEVRGQVSALALALAWTCDLIIAAEGTEFVDLDSADSTPVLLAHAHELGPRRAKELMYTGDALRAEEAAEIGMVTKVLPADNFEQASLAFAARVAAVPSITGLLIKDAINQSVDNMGYENAVRHAAAIWQQAGLPGGDAV